MTAFDFTLLGILGTSVLLGIWRGLIKELLSLVAFGLAFLAAIWWGPDLSSLGILNWVKHDYLKLGIAYAALFIATLLAVGVLNMAMAAMLKSTGLSPADRGLGAIFGLLRGILFMLILVTIAGYTPLIEEPWWQEAMFSEQVVGVIQQLKHRMPEPIDQWLPY